MINIDWNEIKEKYPNSLNSLIKSITKLKKFIPDELLILNCLNDFLNNNICYCDIETFFDNNKIIISIIYDLKKGFNLFSWKIKHKNIKILSEGGWEIRSLAKKAVILKAFEILNKNIIKYN